MLPPEFFRDVRMKARHHIQGKILANGEIKVVRVFRGPLKRGAILTLDLNFRPSTPPLAGDPLYSDYQAFKRAKYVEAFLDGEPPELVGEQVKFLSTWTWRPTGDPDVIGYDW
ncbi:MAG: hypothetical protein ABI229_09180 [Gemmatimonadaceae bacterium]